MGGDGRAPIAVVDHAQLAHEQSETTESAILGMPEPGHDIFGEAPVKDIKSDAYVAADPEPVREEKEISSVGGGNALTTKAAPSPDVPENNQAAQDAAHDEPAEKAPTVEGPPASASGADPAAAAAAAAKAGPLGEAEVEAAKAAEELFPEAI